jgi:ABC-2 type transport system permease protein
MSADSTSLERTLQNEPERRRPHPLRQQLRVLRVIAGAEFKLKYAGSALGYVWSVVKPLALFTMLYLVFGRVFKLGTISHYYPVALLMGIVLFTFWSDASTLGMNSLVARESLLRKMSFPRLIIPTAATLTAAITFAINATVIAAFVAWNGIVPRVDWLLLVPLLAELYLFVLGVSLLLSTLFVRFRDVGQIWELVLQVLFYASPIIYPVGYLPPWARQVAFLSPFTQILQDVRSIVLYPDIGPNKITAADAFHSSAGRLLPIAIAFAIFGLGLYVFKREEPWFAERV